METKINHTMVGGSVLGILIFLVIFLVWIGGGNKYGGRKNIEISFSSVSGLQETGVVKFQGVDVGSIHNIRINPKDPKEILVRVGIDKNLPIKRDTIASIESQGITGTSFIQLSGGSIEAPEIRKEKEEEYPKIRGRASFLAQAIDSAPKVINQLGELTTEIKDVVNEENREAFKDILSNVKNITDALTPANGEEAIDFHTIIKNLNMALKEAENAAKEISLSAKEIRELFSENRKNIKSFSGIGMTALTKFLTEAQQTLATFKRVAEALERSPARFFHNDPEHGVKLR